jgi:putative colanic acid biosynthesis UDP-glucose lipid carrier transferase
VHSKPFKYFHYFIALLCFDIMVIFGIGWFFSVHHLMVIGGLWLISNFINYPRIATRRFISYYQLMSLTVKQFATFLAFWALGFIISNSFPFEDQIYAPLVVASVFVSRLFFVFILRLYRIFGRGYNRFYMVGSSPAMTDMKNKFLSKKGHGYILEGQSASFNFDEISDLVVERHLNEIYCSAQVVGQNELTKLLGLALRYGVNVRVVSDLAINNNQHDGIDTSLLLYSEIDLEKFPLIDMKNLVIKRFFDIIFSSIIILTVLWWVTIILGVLIKLESKGPIFFRQPRSGRDGTYFMCLKFRSMKVTSIEKQATKNDSRITRVGSLIRKLSIDELPQFINVLRGQMSVVGPRPHIKLLNDKYGAAINNYEYRMLVKPGITGLSQISGLRGETVEDQSMENRVKVDLIYIETWSIRKDMIIVIRTIYDLLFMRHNDVF